MKKLSAFRNRLAIPSFVTCLVLFMGLWKCRYKHALPEQMEWLEDYPLFGTICSEARFYSCGESQHLPESKIFIQRKPTNI